MSWSSFSMNSLIWITSLMSVTVRWPLSQTVRMNINGRPCIYTRCATIWCRKTSYFDSDIETHIPCFWPASRGPRFLQFPTKLSTICFFASEPFKITFDPLIADSKSWRIPKFVTKAFALSCALTVNDCRFWLEQFRLMRMNPRQMAKNELWKMPWRLGLAIEPGIFHFSNICRKLNEPFSNVQFMYSGTLV